MKFFKLPDALNKRGIASKWKKFTSGFTLVELVVVIAILAILSGIGVLGYNGYIEYAQRAADEELIAAVNTAFAATCEEQGIDRALLEFGDVTLLADDPDSETSPIKSILTVSALKADPDALKAFQDAFDSYFKGNEKTALKYYNFDEILFADGKTMFTGDKDKIEQGKTNKAKSSFNKSNYHNDIEGLVGNVENVTSLFSLLMNGSVGQPLEDRLSILGMLGVDTSGAVEAFRKMGITDDSSGTEIANAMVLYVAEVTAQTDTSPIVDAIVAGDAPDNMLVGLPMMVGLYTAYYNSPYASQSYKDAYKSAMETGGMAILNLKPQEDSGYSDYVNNGEIRTDLEGYLGALTLVNQNKDSVDIHRADAFSNDDFMDLIKSVLGSA